MSFKSLFYVLTLFTFVNMIQSKFSESLAENQLWYASAAYCDKDTYMTRDWVGETEGFICTKVLYDTINDITGYVGYNPESATIQVTMRGTDSFRNQVVDARFLKESVDWDGCDNCKVHRGFYEGEQSVSDDMINEVNKLKEQYPHYQLRVAGHSLGGALATLAAVDLYNNDNTLIPSLYTYGQPRVGNPEFVDYMKSILPDSIRLTHANDRYPHLPFTEMDYLHFPTEVWEEEDGTLKICDGSGEDPTCINSVPLIETNTEDHYVYLGMDINCDSVSSSNLRG